MRRCSQPPRPDAPPAMPNVRFGSDTCILANSEFLIPKVKVDWWILAGHARGSMTMDPIDAVEQAGLIAEIVGASVVADL